MGLLKPFMAWYPVIAGINSLGLCSDTLFSARPGGGDWGGGGGGGALPLKAWDKATQDETHFSYLL